MPPAKPETAPSPVSAIFMWGIDVPGHGTVSSVGPRTRHKDIGLAITDHGLVVANDDGRRILVPWPNVKVVVL